ncbi:hypothetical protein M0R01_01305 [bacterium]|nr:hypothetical protein [bacterium]
MIESQKKKFVINSSGEREVFSEKKIFYSLRRSGASKETANKIVNEVKEASRQDMRTSDIFRLAKRNLEADQMKIALKFSLKESIKALGPAGFIFEKYVAEIFKQYNYSVKIGQIISGRCITYEMDLIAKKEKVIYLGECKYRNQPGEKIDVNVCLKEFALLSDVRKGRYFANDIDCSLQSLIITNTKFTEQAIKYCECEGLYMLGWRYPKEGGLEKLIEDKKLYPITILPSFKKYLMDFFVGRNMMLAKNILEIKDIAKFAQTAKISVKSMQDLYNDARILLED